MKLLSESEGIRRLSRIRESLRQQIRAGYEYRAKDCLTCEVQGACCTDAHFVNVHITRLEAVAIRQTLDCLPDEQRNAVRARASDAVSRYGLDAEGDTFSKTFACPLFEKGTGCLVHSTAKPLPCVSHACYANAADLPPEELLAGHEREVDDLNRRVYGSSQQWLPLPLALERRR
ncbi:hypothetical protein BH20ACI2_BH20ACI2_01930 [soil metagenome]